MHTFDPNCGCRYCDRVRQEQAATRLARLDVDAGDPAPRECRSCRFWQGGEGRFGECRRRAPVVDTARQLLRVWPETTTDFWCGDYEARN